MKQSLCAVADHMSQLRDVDLRSAAAARCLSSKFEALATPIVYRVLSLNENAVAPDAELKYPNLLSNIATYTSHVVARSDLEPSGTARVLASIRRLLSVRYVEQQPPVLT